MRYISALDGIRAIAIILVMLFHFHYTLEIGWVGVQLFFVLSGFLITSILLKEKENNLSFYLKRFYWRRSLRIFPLYYLYLLLIAVCFLIFNYPSAFPKLAPYLFTYTYNYYPLIESLKFDAAFTHFWSLCVEEQFYLFWPFVIFFFSKRGLKFLLIIVILFSPLFRLLMGGYLANTTIDTGSFGEIIYRMLPSQLDSFAFGALIPLFSLHKIKKRIGLAFLLVMGVTVLLGLLNLNSIPDDIMPGISSLGYPIGNMINYSHVWSYTVINIASLFLILVVLNSDVNIWYNRILGSKVFIAIGRVSYGLYVYHWVLLSAYRVLIGKYIDNTFLSFSIYFVICYLVSELSYRLFEKFFIDLKDKKFKKISVIVTKT